MSLLKDFFLDLKGEILKSPLRTSVPFSFILMGVEKVMEFEFSCPCKPDLNVWFALFMFVSPALLAFTIMMYLTNPWEHRRCCSCGSRFVRNFFSCLIPSAVWIILLFLDGHYVACGMTYWEGNYVLDQGKPPMKWCELTTTQESMEKDLSRLHFAQSQIAGFSLLCLSCVLALFNLCCRQAQDPQHNQQHLQETPEERPPEVYSLPSY
ncbi:hypothetical protein AOLI_G00290920 [Acnodon oligacanthus]